MRRLLFLLTLALYGFSAMELHEWVRVPQVIVHLLEHHSDFGHHHDDPAEHGHQDDGNGHNPFSQDHQEVCGASSTVSVTADQRSIVLVIPSSANLLVPAEAAVALSGHSGSKWNPPKLG